MQGRGRARRTARQRRLVIYRVATNQLLTLNPTAAIVWERCDGTHNLPAIAAAVGDLFPGSRRSCPTSPSFSAISGCAGCFQRMSDSDATGLPGEHGRGSGGWPHILRYPWLRRHRRCSRTGGGPVGRVDPPRVRHHGASRCGVCRRLELRRIGESWRVAGPGSATYRTASLADALLALEWQLVTDAIAHRRDRFHLHAAALLAPAAPAALIVAGVSGSGKTTLTLGLMARGFLPYSDDATLIDPDTCAPTAFRRAFHVDDGTRSLLAALPTPPDWYFEAAPAGYFSPPRWAEIARPIRIVLFSSLFPDAVPTLAPLTLAQAAARPAPVQRDACAVAAARPADTPPGSSPGLAATI